MKRDRQHVPAKQVREGALRDLTLPPFQPDRALFHVPHDPEHERRRENADPHQHPPAFGLVAHERIAELVDGGRENHAQRVAALQQARDDTPMAGRTVLDGQRHAGRPDAAHANAEQRAAGEQHPVPGRKRAKEGERRDQRIPSISGSLRPKRSAAMPAPMPPRTRNISVTVASAPASALLTVKLRGHRPAAG